MLGKASIILVSYNNLALTRSTLHSVLSTTAYPNYDVVVVDNGSGSETRDWLKAFAREHADRVRLILNERNVGFAAANNVGLRATGDSAYVILLNNDVIVSSRWLDGLLWHLRDPGVGMVGPVTNSAANGARIAVPYRTEGEVESFAARRAAAHRRYAFEIPMLAMFCVAMRRAVVDEIGLLDERFGLGTFEDDDYALRVRAAGYRILCAEDVFVHHVGSASFSKLAEAEYTRLFAFNRGLFEEKWHTTWSAPVGRTYDVLWGRCHASRIHWRAMRQPERAVVFVATPVKVGLTRAARAFYHAVVPHRMRLRWWNARRGL